MNNSAGSFIPSSPVAGNKPSRRVRKIYIISYIVYVFFAVTVITSLGIFAYTQYLGSQITAAKESLVAKQSGFNESALAEISTLEGRLQQASTIYNSQVSLSTVLTAVEEVVLNSVSITGFDYSDLNRMVTLQMTASLPDFNAAVYQRTVLSEHPVFSNASIENISYGSITGGDAEVASGLGNVLTFNIVVPLDGATLRTAEVETYTTPVFEEVATTTEDVLVDTAEGDTATTTNEI